MSDAPSPPEGSADPAGSPERFTLEVPSTFGPRFFATVAIAVGLVVVFFARPLLSSGDGSQLLVLLAAAVVVPGLVALLSASQRRRRRRRLSIEVLPDRLHLPTAGPGRLAVRYRDITALFLQDRDLGGFLYIATKERELTFPLRAFPGEEAERLLRAIRARIASEPDGPRRLGRIDHLARTAERAHARRPVVTWAVVAITAALHVFFVATGRLVGVLDVASLGGVSPELAAVAGPYLAFVSNWVHGWSFQPLLILPGLLVVGSSVERLLGHGVAAAALLGAATAGGLAAAYVPGAPLHAGALIPVMGLAGALAFTSHTYRGRMPIGFRLTGQWWAWVATLVAVAALVHGLSVPGALVGLLVGVVVAALVIDRDPELPLAYSPRWAAWLAGGLVALHVGAAAWAIADLPGRGLELEKVAVESSTNGDRLNEYAWRLAVGAEEPSRARLELALAAARRSVGLEDNELLRLTKRDTEATVLHRLGRHEEAIRLELDVLEARPSAITTATQLARFLAARLDAQGPLTAEGAPVAGLEVDLEAEGEAEGEGEAQRIEARVALSRPPDAPHVLYAPVKGPEGRLEALLRLPLKAGARTATVAVQPVEPRARLEGPFEVAPALTVPGRASAKIWPMADAFLEFP
jgi:hypothetical protein